MNPSSTAPILTVRQITKYFPGVMALDAVDMDLYAGEVLAVIGENGAGKSTLMQILAGAQWPDSGSICLDGISVQIDSCRTAQGLGIALIHQELNLTDNLSVAENIFLGREPRHWGLIDRNRLYRQAAVLLAQIGLEVESTTLVAHLTMGQQQMVEIAKALAVEARILIMDEPTSSLSTEEVRRLFAVIRQLKKSAVSIVYISHRLGEVEQVADRVMVLRDGSYVGGLEQEAITRERMVTLMVGQELTQHVVRNPYRGGTARLQVEGLVSTAWPQEQLDFSIGSGEIVGVAGLVGAGRTEMLQALFGIMPALAGQVHIDGELMQIDSPLAAIKQGLLLVPENRKDHGLVLDMAVDYNIGLPSLASTCRYGGLIDRQRVAQDANRMIGELAIKTPGLDQAVRLLSGGNQQKVVLAKWLVLGPRVLLLDEPTRGIDIGAKNEIYRLLEELAAAGVAILFVSSEMEEVLGLADRVLVMHQGRLSGVLKGKMLKEEAVMHLATGGSQLR